MSDDLIPSIQAAATQVHDAERRLRNLVAKAAVADDANIAAIADAARVTRQTVYRWRADIHPGRTRPYRDPRQAMDEALYAILDAGAGPAHEMTSGLRTNDLKAKARRVLLGAGNVTPSRADEEQVALIRIGCMAANDVLNSDKRRASTSGEGER